MNLRATVLVPTHDHGPTLRHSVASALAQTISDIEVILVGDGIDETAREVIRDLQRLDSRVQFHDFPKGPRRGEIHRHIALEAARGRIVCYLSDDDLWFPNHLEVMDSMLQGDVGFAHALPISIRPDGSFDVWPMDLALPHYRQGTLGGRGVPLSCGGHTLEAYRRLAVGWSTTPAKVLGTDIYMWQKLLRSGCGVLTGTHPTVLTFPSPLRSGWPMRRRAGELADWSERIAQAEWRATFVDEVLDYVVRERARLHAHAPRTRMIGLLTRIGLFPPMYRLRTVARGVFARAKR